MYARRKTLACVLCLAALAVGDPLGAAARNESIDSSPEWTKRAREREGESCLDEPTRRVDLFVNLDADVFPGGWSTHFHGIALGTPQVVPDATTRVTLRDAAGRPRPIEINWARHGIDDWGVAVTPPRESPPASPNGTLSIPLIFPRPGTYGMLRFDAQGELIGPDELEVLLPAEPVVPASPDAPVQMHPEQAIVLRFRSPLGTTTQYASSYLEMRVEGVSGSCRDGRRSPGSRGCFLSSTLRGDPVGGDGASIFFDARGRLVANARQHVRGHPIERTSGAQERATSDALVPAAMTPPRATSHVVIGVELDRLSSIESIPASGWVAGSAPSQRIHVDVVDPVGRPRRFAIDLVRTAREEWSWFAVDTRSSFSLPAHAGFAAGAQAQFAFTISDDALPALEIPTDGSLDGLFSNGPGEALLAGGSGRLRFDDAGRLAEVAQTDSPESDGADPTVLLPPDVFGAIPQPIRLVFDRDGTRIADAARIGRIEQDGRTAGTVTSVHVTSDFVLESLSSNGAWTPVSALAFASPGDSVCRFVCSNHRDDDRDGRVDAGEDPGCASGFDGTE